MDASAEITLIEMRNQSVYKPRQTRFTATALAAEQNALALLNVQRNVAQALLAGFSITEADVFYRNNSGTPPIAENITSATNSADAI
jgi:hypothetical protein